MIEFYLAIPMEIKVIIGSCMILALLQHRKDKVWERQKQKNHR